MLVMLLGEENQMLAKANWLALVWLWGKEGKRLKKADMLDGKWGWALEGEGEWVLELVLGWRRATEQRSQLVL